MNSRSYNNNKEYKLGWYIIQTEGGVANAAEIYKVEYFPDCVL